MATNDKQVIFSLVGVGKVYPPKKQVLRDIYLGFYYGAKIGVLGLNGSGKSSLLKIIAGVDPNYVGEITRSKGYSVGLLEQEPQLDPNKTVKVVVEEGKKELVALLHEYEAVSNSMGDAGPDEMEKLIDKQAQLQEKIEAANGWELESELEIAASIFSCNCACLSMSFSISSGLASPMLLLTASYSCSKATSSFLPSSTTSLTVLFGSSCGSCSSKPTL